MGYRRGRQFSWRNIRWQEYLNTQTPQGRFGIFALLLVALAILSWLASFNSATLSRDVAILVGRVLGIVIGFTLHEWAHAYTAFRLGGYRALPDPSRLSLDPRVHLDPIGTLLAVLVGFGWARPVPVYPQAFYPNETRGAMLVSFAGPLMNLLLAASVGFFVRVLILVGGIEAIFTPMGFSIGTSSIGVVYFFANVMTTFVFFNIILFLFNLIPLSPLDGWRVMLGLLPNEQAIQMQRYERESNLLLWFIIIIGFLMPISPLWLVLGPLSQALFQIVTGISIFL